jgi:dTDP-4-amino-4,6-dideoxygalactose transaminase
MGPQEKNFESAVNEYIGSRHAIAVSSGTAGMHLCIRAAGIEDGDWALTTPFSFVASANVLLYERAAPIFVDVDRKTGNIDPIQVAKAAADLKVGGSSAQKWLPRRGVSKTGQLRAILAVDVFGQPADYDQLSKIATENELDLIEDSCEALGSSYKGRLAGRFGRASAFAFYPNKQMTTGEGGIVITEDDDWSATIRSLRNQGRAPGDTWLTHTHLGYNYRLNELSAALGVVQMSRLDEMIEKREQVAAWYSDELGSISGIRVPWVSPDTTRMSWFVYVVRFEPSIDRNRIAEALKEQGIPSRPYFLPIHLQPYMVERFGYQEGDFPVTEDLGRRGLALPFSSVMSQDQVQRVAEAIRNALARM